MSDVQPPVELASGRASEPTPSAGLRRWAGLAAALVAAVALVAVSSLPSLSVPTLGASDAGAQISRVCPGLPDAALGVGSDGSGLTMSALASPTITTAVPSGSPLPLGADPVRVSAPAGTSFWGVSAAASASGPEQGLSLAACRQPRSESWLTGVRSNANAKSELVLVNLDATEADVNLTVYGTGGPLPAAGARGVVVAGRSERVLPLGPIVTSDGPLTLQVSASSGRVTSFVRQHLFNGLASLGSDWISVGSTPDTMVVIPSVPGGPGLRTLVIGNPDERTAQVKVEVLGTNGAFAPVGVEQVDVPAKSTREFNLDTALAGKATALRLTSSRAIVGAVESRTANDFATLNGVPPIGPGATVLLPLPNGVTPVVTLANPIETPIKVEATISDATGKQLAHQAVDLAASTSIVLEPGAVTNSVLKVTSSDVALRVSVAATGTMGPVSGIAVLAVMDASSTAPAVELSRDPAVGSGG